MRKKKIALQETLVREVVIVVAQQGFKAKMNTFGNLPFVMSQTRH